MGGVLNRANNSVYFRIKAQADHTPLSAVEIVKGWFENGELREETLQVWNSKDGAAELCATWQDPDFDNRQPAFWYAAHSATKVLTALYIWKS